MQSFLTSTSSFIETAQVLDNKRLHKQTLEAWQCLLTIANLDPDGNHREPKGWSNHPVVKMWRGYETAFVSYISATYFEWKSRGYKSSLLEKTLRTYDLAVDLGRISDELVMPAWITDTAYFSRLTSTHRTALLCKNYDWYSQFGWPEDSGTQPETYEYLWPHQDGFTD
jgi:hypothetical protein